jgi:hypothetical protein
VFAQRRRHDDGVASIVVDYDSVVHGVLYSITERGLRMLDASRARRTTTDAFAYTSPLEAVA